MTKQQQQESESIRRRTMLEKREQRILEQERLKNKKEPKK